MRHDSRALVRLGKSLRVFGKVCHKLSTPERLWITDACNYSWIWNDEVKYSHDSTAV